MEKEIGETNIRDGNENSKKKGFCTFSYISSCEKHNIFSVVVAFTSIFLIIIISFEQCRRCFKNVQRHEIVSELHTAKKNFWVYGHNYESGYLKNVFLILSKAGYEKSQYTTDWDLLWAHDYPFRTLYSNLSNLKPHQKVNHFPGCGHITNKVDLATSGLEYVPPAFKLPRDKEKLLQYVKKNPAVEFVQKNNDHRNIKIQNISDIDLNSEGTFVQQYVDKPLLVSGCKFDIGIYTIITSVDPLRVYVYNGDALLRFCPVKYYPFDPTNLDKYVVGDDYLPTWDVPDLTYYYETLGFGMRESLNAYLHSKHKDPRVIWAQIEDSIRILMLAKEQQIIDAVNRFPSKRNFFEMMRIDFVVDENMKVYLMEANMSPNLSSAHYPPNQLLYEQVISNLFALVGISERLENERNSALTFDKILSVFPRECNSALCRSSCVSPMCHLCRPCLSVETRDSLVEAYREHINRGECKRIFPPPIVQDRAAVTSDIEKYSVENQIQYKWFQGKCLLDASWC